MIHSPDDFANGQPVPASGIYSVKHSAHRLFSQVALFKGEQFPRCARCAGTVMFRMMRKFNGLDAAGTPKFRVPLLELKEVGADIEPLSAA
jgi:hypothetical protein